MTLKKLLKTRFAVVVKNAIDNKELDRNNVEDWVQQYNNGMVDEMLVKEIWMLIRYYKVPVVLKSEE